MKAKQKIIGEFILNYLTEVEEAHLYTIRKLCRDKFSVNKIEVGSVIGILQETEDIFRYGNTIKINPNGRNFKLVRLNRSVRRLNLPIIPSIIFNNLDRHFKIFGIVVKTFSKRFHMFKETPHCVMCGKKGNAFFIEKHTKRRDANNKPLPPVYVLKYCIVRGKNVMEMTLDHWIPLHAGGADEMSNLYPMCRECNHIKGGDFPKRLFPPFFARKD
jgi:hypothetical protein